MRLPQLVLCSTSNGYLMKHLLSFFLLALGCVASPLALAQGAVTSVLTAQRVDTEAGKPVLKPATATKPGDVIAYAGTYRNGGTAAADKLMAVIPVPVGTTLVAGSAEPAQAQASTDGARFAPMPLMRSVKLADGSEKREPVPLADYRALRWELGSLAPAASSVVALRVRVDTPEAASAAVRPAPKP